MILESLREGQIDVNTVLREPFEKRAHRFNIQTDISAEAWVALKEKIEGPAFEDVLSGPAQGIYLSRYTDSPIPEDHEFCRSALDRLKFNLEKSQSYAQTVDIYGRAKFFKTNLGVLPKVVQRSAERDVKELLRKRQDSHTNLNAAFVLAAQIKQVCPTSQIQNSFTDEDFAYMEEIFKSSANTEGDAYLRIALTVGAHFKILNPKKPLLIPNDSIYQRAMQLVREGTDVSIFNSAFFLAVISATKVVFDEKGMQLIFNENEKPQLTQRPLERKF